MPRDRTWPVRAGHVDARDGREQGLTVTARGRIRGRRPMADREGPPAVGWPDEQDGDVDKSDWPGPE